MTRRDVVVTVPGPAVPGHPLVVTVGLPGGSAPVVGGTVELVRRIAYRYRTGNLYGGRHSTVTRSHSVEARAELTPALTAALDVPAHSLPSVDASLVEIAWSLLVRLHGEDGTEQTVERSVTVAGPELPADTPAMRPFATDSRHAVVVAFDPPPPARVAPGDELAGTVVLAAQDEVRVSEVRVELVLTEETFGGPWSPDVPAARRPADDGMLAETVAAAVPLTGAVVLEPGPALRLPFALPVPERLPGPSVSTDRFALRWSVRAVVDRRLRRRPYASVGVVVGRSEHASDHSVDLDRSVRSRL